MDAEIKDVDLNNKPAELAQFNPYNRVPVLVDRDLKLYESTIICEYLDDRFPHPQLMPSDIAMRGKARLMLHIFDRELFVHLDVLLKKRATPAARDRARQILRDELLRMLPNFSRRKYFLGDEFSILDIAIAPLLWRLEHFRIRLTPRAAPILKYAERLFARPGFINSLTAVEKAMRK